MGRRSRKRMSDLEPAQPAPGSSRAERDRARQRRVAEAGGQPTTRRRGPGGRDRPPAPWGSFPLSEVVVLLALVLGIAGLVIWGDRGRVMIVAAMALGSLAGLELSLREHLAGYRSHTSLLAGACTFAAVTILLVAAGGGDGVALGAVALLAAVVFAGSFWAFRQVFKSRSGGLGFR